ncbi:hypothetical protein N7471_009377 [Penicillium samsonianum]|uniref:uncharacterized protein n=1 Tax=Penicillium samsonianum TaxID=1882272 RepID=UPI0025485549|nr:uncharacterized protein N7471_009377 [Penicillium samsonianum]KAJ6128160.1 hypothetical protein N7471_009377 [Penicillium samsonianum]
MGEYLENREVGLRPSPKSHTRDLFSLEKRTYIVTGGIGSLGQEIATGIMQSGGDVICIDSVEIPPMEQWEDLQILAKACSAKLWYYKCDITNIDTTRSLFREAVTAARFPLRGLVTCAGISSIGRSIDFSIDEMRRIIDVNLTGTFICAQSAAREIFEQGFPASIVFIASMSGHVVNKGFDTAAYSCSKSGVHQLTRNLASEWGSPKTCPLIRVNSLSPGYIRTRMTEDLLKDPIQEGLMSKGSMLNRISTPDEYRGPVVFLLSDASSYVTGADLLVDGGHTGW